VQIEGLGDVVEGTAYMRTRIAEAAAEASLLQGQAATAAAAVDAKGRIAEPQLPTVNLP
jgi:hypothetical protein